MHLTHEEYRSTRASIRNASMDALDALDGLHRALSYGDASGAKEYSRTLAMAADDLTALCERVLRSVTYRSPE